MNRPLILFFLCITTFPGFSQSKESFSINISDKSLEETFELLSKKHQLEFKYQRQWVDTVSVDVKMTYDSVSQLLNKILFKKGFNYLKRDPNYIILLRNSNTNLAINQKKVDKDAGVLSLGEIQFEKSIATLSGTLIAGEDNTPISGATIIIDNKKKVNSNDAGYYEIEVSTGYHDFEIKTIETDPVHYELNIYSSANLDLTLFKNYQQLEGVVVSAKRLDENVSEVIAGKENITIQEVEKMPAFLGEADIIKTLLTLPGVSTTGEASTGFNVRGVGAGNNLIFADGALVFNTSHMLGIFAAFNSNSVGNVDFYKGVKPARYGGRVGSVLNVEFATGNKERMELEGGVGLLASNISMGIPIVQNKSSLQTGIRFAYPNYLNDFVRNDDLKNSSAFFGDGQFKYSDKINESNHISFSAYISSDDFNFANELLYQYGQQLATINWDHIYSNDLSSSIYYSISNYQSNLTTLNEDNEISDVLSTSINAHQLNFDYTWDKISKHELGVGVNNTFYIINPREFSSEILDNNSLAVEQAIETAIYVDDIISWNKNLTTYIGGRFTAYSGILDRQSDLAFGFDPRISFNYSFGKSTSIKMSYNRSRQFLHLISNTTSISPVDMRKLSNGDIKPAVSDQISLGIFKNLFNNNVEISLEAYKGWINNVIDLKNGADLTQSLNLENELLQGVGNNYGVEFYAKKKRGDFTGWISYTYSRSFNQINGNSTATSINLGEWYPSNFDQPHVMNVFSDYRFNRRLNLSLNFVYNTGRTATFPIAVYNGFGLNIIDYSSRNNYRIPDYHRLDLSLHVSPPLKKHQKIRGSWTFTLYNVYGRRNAYSVFYRPSPVNYQLNAYQLSVIGSMVPSITYNFKLK